MNASVSTSIVTEPPVWFIAGCFGGIDVLVNNPGIVDPVRAVKAIINAVQSGNQPHHLLRGNDAFEGAMAKIDALRTQFKAGGAVARAADFPKSKQGALV